jgi:dolichol-phosphate mannosyltransferase
MMGCAQMLMLGIIGEYLGRLYMQSKQRPLFVIADVVRMQESAVSPRSVPRLVDVRQG